MRTVLEDLNRGLHTALAENSRVFVLGEDILDPYGGAFKVTQGLSSRFPGRVLTTPISEAGIVGTAAGMALRGLRPVVEIMFGDFVTLAADQLINHAAKYRWMYNDQVRVPLVVRTPMGGRRGYGPTHSQSLEKHFLGVPGLTVIAPTSLDSPGNLLAKVVLETEDPILFVENKLLYLEEVRPDEQLSEFDIVKKGYPPAYSLRLKGAPPPRITLAAYGYMAGLAWQAARRLAYEEEIFSELVVLTQLSPVYIAPILESVQETGRLVTIEEGSQTLGWGAEVLAQTAASLGPKFTAGGRTAAADLPIPASGPLEEVVLPDVDDISQRIREISQQ